MGAVQRHDPPNGAQLAGDLVDDRKEFLADEQDLGLGVVDDMQHFRRRQAPVHRHHHRTGLGHAEQKLEIEVAALVEMGHPCPRPDTLGNQPLRDAAGGAVQRGVARRPALVDQGGCIRPVGGMRARNIGEAKHLEPHLAFLRVLVDRWSATNLK
jgi:hypothetical protein